MSYGGLVGIFLRRSVQQVKQRCQAAHIIVPHMRCSHCSDCSDVNLYRATHTLHTRVVYGMHWLSVCPSIRLSHRAGNRSVGHGSVGQMG